SVYKSHPDLLLMCSSSSAMWTANTATITPSKDALDGKVHFTPANLASNLHRAIEVAFSAKVLRCIFADSRYFRHHQPLPSAYEFFDEGAANHTRFSNGLQLFVYGRKADSTIRPTKYPARQTKEAQMAIARLHCLPEEKLLFFQQNPAAIDSGVFHNDVISTGYGKLFLYHEDAFVETSKKIKQLERHFPDIECIQVTKKELSLHQAVTSYLFNSQIIESEPNEKLLLICPTECKQLSFLQKLTPHPFDDILFVDLRQSMMNGGGPACLRLRIEVTDKEMKAIHKGVFFTLQLYKEIQQAINKWYPDTFTITDLLDADFRKSCKVAHEKIVSLLQLEL
ncbi:MAG TPA: N-succinylarginine dihydrolase, partial [Chlamydiales bacterium]|nr:N-succinylarginine dihydrolase [Chlamydiales bacterium]